MSSKILARFLLSGRVQGVGCRAQVKSIAAQVENLSGWVRNLVDGRVELWVLADKVHIESYESLLKAKLRFPVRLDSLEKKVFSAKDLPTGFVENEFLIVGDGVEPHSI